jgi:hypothetical protein
LVAAPELPKGTRRGTTSFQGEVVFRAVGSEVVLIVNTVEDRRSAIQDSYSIRRSALQARVTYFTTIAGARAACTGMQHMPELTAYSLQELHARLR